MAGQKGASILNHVYTAAPCSVRWESMSGDDRVRACSGCDRNVWNLSNMTRSEAEAFIKENGASQCTVFYRRADGTIMTDNCPVGLRIMRDKYRKLSSAAAGLVAILFGVAPAHGQERPKEDHLPYPGNMVIALPESTEKKPDQSGKCTLGPGKQLTLPHPAEGEPKNPKEPARLKAKAVVRADAAALELYKKANENEKQGKYLVAEVYYKQALSALNPKNHDWKFKQLIEADLKEVQRKSRAAASGEAKQ